MRSAWAPNNPFATARKPASVVIVQRPLLGSKGLDLGAVLSLLDRPNAANVFLAIDQFAALRLAAFVARQTSLRVILAIGVMILEGSPPALAIQQTRGLVVGPMVPNVNSIGPAGAETMWTSLAKILPSL